MRKHARGSVFDVSIRGDELEQNRIQLENNLQKTDLSFRLSSASDDEHNQHNHDSSIEYPRHYSGPPPFPELPSFTHRSMEYADEDTPGQIQAWSYRTADDDEGINPYGAETLSTAAHHASALTISAGLGGRAARHEVSLSGAEYDPERPVQDIIAGVETRLGALDLGRPKSKQQSPRSNLGFDPVVVDNTAELDRILETGRTLHPHLTPPAARLVSPLSASSSTSDSESVRSITSARPKLTDALRRVTFSPKRPRSPHISRKVSLAVDSPSPLVKGDTVSHSGAEMNMPTPKPPRRTRISPSLDTSVGARPEVVLQPPTPSTTASNFTRMARGIVKDIDEQKNFWKSTDPNSEASDARPSVAVRNPITRKGVLRQSVKGRVHLPDVTGLTSAVESPAKFSAGYFSFRGESRPRDIEARLISTLAKVQKKLQYLEEENGISRRRVRELEMELEECKREVARERTKLIEHEKIIGQQWDSSMRANWNSKGWNSKGKGRAANIISNEETMKERYKEAVEEKKALEALINSLRTHLTRLTAELSSHQEMLSELRSLRETDERALRQKSDDITRLNEEVERIAGEIEVLRGVVEEGLKERRTSRENSVQHSAADASEPPEVDLDQDQDQDQDHDRGEDVEAEDLSQQNINSQIEGEKEESLSSSDDEDLEDEEDGDPFSINTSRSTMRQADKTMRTDHATAGSTNLSNLTPAQPIDPDDLDRGTPGQVKPATSSSLIGRGNSRPVTSVPETPFPQIRGEYLERLFFSAPEHNAKTCMVCHRRRRRTADVPSPSFPYHSRNAAPSRPAAPTPDEAEDESFAAGSEEAEMETGGREAGKQRQRVAFADDGNRLQNPRMEGLPPQTILTRVIRELEDDFTHYKSIYIELADQYKDMDAASDVPKRNMLAQHLREVIDILEQKGDQIASLYDLLTFKDKPSVEPANARPTLSKAQTTIRDYMGSRQSLMR